MDLIPIQFSDLKVGQPLPWDLFDQERKPLMERGHVIKTTDELGELSKKSSVFLRLEASSEKVGAIDKKISEFNFDDMQLKVGDRLQLQLHSSAKSSCRLRYGNSNRIYSRSFFDCLNAKNRSTNRATVSRRRSDFGAFVQRAMCI